MRFRLVGPAVAAALTLTLAGCGDDDGDEAHAAATTVSSVADGVETTVSSLAEQAEEAARDAWATFRTGFERLVDEASTGAENARTELLDQCRDALGELRQADDGRAEDLGPVCDRIRDADGPSAWDDLRREVQELAP